MAETESRVTKNRVLHYRPGPLNHFYRVVVFNKNSETFRNLAGKKPIMIVREEDIRPTKGVLISPLV